MPSPDSDAGRPKSPELQPGRPSTHRDDAGANTDLIRLVAAAADLCRKPLRHGVVAVGEPAGDDLRDMEVSLRLEARSPEGERQPQQDLELEIYPSGAALHLMLSRPEDEQAPLLWHGGHPVWLRGDTGERCERPADGAALEAFSRRLQALLAGDA